MAALPTAILLAATAAVSHARWLDPKIETGPGSMHTCVLTTVGEVKCWGMNNAGQLGIGSGTKVLGGAADFDGNSLQPVDLGDDRYAVALATGDFHTCAALDNGKAKCWGSNSAGQLGYGDDASRGTRVGDMGNSLPDIDLGSDSSVVNIWAGSLHTCALLENHEVKCWGRNNHGQLGWTTAGGSHGKGSGDMGANLASVDFGVSPDGPFVSDMALGKEHTCALFTDGTMKCWGINGWGHLGYGDQIARGAAAGTMGTALPPIDLGSGRTAVQISAGDKHSCALLDNKAVVCWGGDAQGQTGRGGCGGSQCGDEPDEMGDNINGVDFGTSGKPVELKSGSLHSCAVLDDASVKCWGGNANGALGYGDTEDRGLLPASMGEANWPKVDLGPNSQALHVGCAQHTCAVLNDGQVKCFGLNGNGMHGIGDANEDQWGDEPGEMGSDLPTVLTMALTSTMTASTTTGTATDTHTTTMTAIDTTVTTAAALIADTSGNGTDTTTMTTADDTDSQATISSAQSPGGGLAAPLAVVALAIWARL